MHPAQLLPPACLIPTLTWEIESAVRLAQRQQPDPGSGPPNRLFIPDAVRSRVLLWAHFSKLTCHPGITRILDFIRRDSGGHPWMRTSVRSSQRAQPVPGIRPRLGPVPVYFDHYPFLADLGLTLPRHRSAPVRGQHHHPHSDRPLFQGCPLHRASQASLLKGDCGPPGQARILLRLRLLSTPVPFVSDLPHPSVYI